MIKKTIDTLGSKWIFVICIVGLYIVTSVFNSDIVIAGLYRSGEIALEVVPVLIGIFILTFLLNVYMRKKDIKPFLAKQDSIGAYTLAAIFGTVSMGPIYVWFPFLRELKKDGLHSGIITVFLYNRAVKIPLIPVIIHYFGVPFLVLTTSLMIVFSFINGYVMNRFVKN